MCDVAFVVSLQMEDAQNEWNEDQRHGNLPPPVSVLEEINGYEQADSACDRNVCPVQHFHSLEFQGRTEYTGKNDQQDADQQ
jgi:hypothetical protein